ncbi:hypothetical protein Apa02nite_083420 [Actinoplanes palleronii]|uniref:Uncharacterized protein n=1 Tax=Actinoplanes palleronii TaxID=113570 RepID=A0ABQ4BNI0_9ACTN|nr:hypothetical protein Apa02nite_083420 [Actinoplanes palleronii]
MVGYRARVEIQVVEGALVEVPTADVTGMDRRAFGEFVSPRGEMASYAFGWTTGADPHVGHLTIGIGVGNPGGGSFHAVIFVNDDGIAYALTDEPFERVPEGGPDLTADQARAHDTLPFIWWVTDLVMERDRRAHWMRHWLLGTLAVQSTEVFEQREPALRVSHHAEDGVWHLVGASGADGDTGRVGHLHHAVDEDQSLIDVLNLQPGHTLVRDDGGRPWHEER